MLELTWTCRDGRRVRVCDMSTSHIQNCIRLIEQSGGKWRGDYLPRLHIELDIRALKSRGKT